MLCVCVQVYNETIRDLLAPSGPLNLREDSEQGQFLSLANIGKLHFSAPARRIVEAWSDISLSPASEGSSCCDLEHAGICVGLVWAHITQAVVDSGMVGVAAVALLTQKDWLASLLAIRTITRVNVVTSGSQSSLKRIHHSLVAFCSFFLLFWSLFLLLLLLF